MIKIQVMNGPNLNMLGVREPSIYGNSSLSDIDDMIRDEAKTLGVEVFFFQSNHEGALIDELHACYQQKDGVIINPGAFTHYSYAIRDAIASIGIPTVEVHLSDIKSRESFRQHSVTKDVCIKQISGLGPMSYIEALRYLVKTLHS